MDKAMVGVYLSINKENESSYVLSAKWSLLGIDKEKAQQITDAAHQGCPYSKATRGNIEVKTIID